MYQEPTGERIDCVQQASDLGQIAAAHSSQNPRWMGHILDSPSQGQKTWGAGQRGACRREFLRDRLYFSIRYF